MVDEFTDRRKAATITAMTQLELSFGRTIEDKRVQFFVDQFERDGWLPSEIESATQWCLQHCRMMPVYSDFCGWYREQYDGANPGRPVDQR